MLRRSLSVVLLLLAPAFLSAAEYKTKNLILVTADGLRWQEVFTGIDPVLMNHEDTGMKDSEELRKSLWAESPEERRQLLMPFLWTELVPNGVLFGNAERGAAVTLSNQHRFSYPGYSEILTGKPQDDVINSNDLRPNPSRTVLEILREQVEAPEEQSGSLRLLERLHRHWCSRQRQHHKQCGVSAHHNRRRVAPTPKA